MRQRLFVEYLDPAKPRDEIALGAFAQIAAKRRFGLEVVKSDDPEVALFGCFVELVGPAKAAEPDAFDEWLQTIEDFGLVKSEDDDDEDPQQAETQSSGSSPGSPPTSD